MPECEQLSEDFITADTIATEDLKLGDVIFDTTIDGQVFKANVVGFEEDEAHPIIDRYDKGSWNNVLRKPFYRILSHKE